MKKFNHEVNKISKNVCFDDLENLIDQKRNDLIKKIKERENEALLPISLFFCRKLKLRELTAKT